METKTDLKKSTKKRQQTASRSPSPTSSTGVGGGVGKNDEGKIYTEYFQLTKKYREEYGKNTVVLMQVGAFFEIYGLCSLEKEYTNDSSIQEVAEFCQLNIAEKKYMYHSHSLVMAGFRDHTLEKYLQRITENQHTAVVFVQEKNEKNTTRIFHSIHSAGTYISFDLEQSNKITNNIMTIWFELYHPTAVTTATTAKINPMKSRDRLIYGISVVNTFTGSSSLFEYETPFIMSPSTFDELERNIAIYNPCEVLFVSPFEQTDIDKIVQNLGLRTEIIHFYSSKTNAKTEKCGQQKYIHHILSTFYGEETLQICSEFQNNIIATQSFCFLLNFIQEHNRNLVKNIGLPVFNNTTEHVLLANHTLKQLNIIEDTANDDRKQNGHLSSVLSFLNKCCSSLGKRRFQHQLLNPTFNEEWIEQQYQMTDILLHHHYSIIDPIRKLLSQVKDIEKICRQIVLQKIYPSSIYSLHQSLENILKIKTIMVSAAAAKISGQSQSFESLLYPYLNSGMHQEITHTDVIEEVLQFIHRTFYIDKCKGIHSIHTFDDNIVRPGISSVLDIYCNKQIENKQIIDDIRDNLNKIIREHIISAGGKDETEYVKIHETEKSGLAFQITKKRGGVLKTVLSKIQSQTPYLVVMKTALTETNEEIHIPIKDIKFSSSTNSNDEIEIPIVNKLSRELQTLKEKINKEIFRIYQEFIIELSFSKTHFGGGVLEENTKKKPWFDILENIAEFAGRVDVLQCKTYIAKEYNYCRPFIAPESSLSSKSTADSSFVVAKQLRHVLIEHIQQNEIYVPNDISIGWDDITGILLYGINTSGKTSLIRSVGIAVIMAQSGLFVPCKEFIYRPYRSIFSRILGNDNLFKGLSTFAVEMSELRTILKMADHQSLVIGDELCSGTEIQSAISIFIAGLINLYEKRCSFLFATHLHEIVKYDEIRNMRTLKIKHLSIHFDSALGCIIYDRILQDGAGSQNYGLIVCRSLFMPEEFLEEAYQIRAKYFPETNGELSFSTTKYNAQKIKGKCEMCKENLAEEIHHIREQQEANPDGYIDGFHKNHIANLAGLCGKCHDKMHRPTSSPPVNENMNPIIKKIRKKTSKGYQLVSILNKGDI
jgi:DNA mismatch repair protein MutS